MKLRFLLPLVAIAVLAHGENEIGFIERFALAPDREKVLTELVPGTEDYYFYHALHFQNSKQPAKLAAILDQWQKRTPNSPRRKMIEHREALLAYDADPQRTLDFLRKFFGLRFDHQQEQPDAKPNLPTQLDPALVARDVFVREALRDDDLGKCSSEALARLVEDKVALRPPQRRALLAKIERPNVPGLVELIAADLASQESRGFGEHSIHRLLLPAQLDQLAKLRPLLVSEQSFVFARLRHLAPSVEEDVEFDAAARAAWLDRTWAYAKSLPAAFNSLKAALLYRRLDHDRKRGTYDEARFTEYLKLPRQTNYVAQRWLDRLQSGNTTWVDLNARFDEAALVFPPIGNDEPLVRDYFLAIFAAKAQAGWERFAEWARDTWLKPVFAEALLVRGLGNAEQLASLLTPAEFQRLSERVDLDFLATNPRFFAPADDVSLDLEVKNAPKLIVKVYELNALNYFLANKRQLNTDLPLDGLVANAETTHEFTEPPLRRVRRTFKFPELKGRRGAWIVEFIGGGRSSRALVRKGQWSVVQQTGPAGDLLTVLDEKHAPVPDAAVWLDGRKFTPDAKTGAALVPFTAQPGRKPVVVADASDTFATLTEFEHHAEAYTLDAQFHIEREQLLAGREATLSIRAALRLHEALLPLPLLHEPKLTLTTKTLDGIETTREVKDLKLDATALFTHRFPVPERLASVTATLSGQVEQLSKGGEKLALGQTMSWDVNGIDGTDATFDGHLSRFDAGYVFELPGKNGEAVADRQVVFEFRREMFSHGVTVPLRTDERGRIALGPLASVAVVTAKLPNNQVRTWTLNDAARTNDYTVHVAVGQPFEVPLLRAGTARTALLELRNGTHTAERTASITASADGLPHIRSAGLPPGDYTLLLPDEERRVTIKVTQGTAAKGWVFGPARALQLTPAKPLRIARIDAGAKEIAVTLANASAFTRVHLAATRFAPREQNLFVLGGGMRFGGAAEIPARLPNLFAGGRDIGDEYRYILERRYALKFPGNMLARPGLLLNPWEKRTTDQSALDQRAMQRAPATPGERAPKPQPTAPPMPAAMPLIAGSATSANLDFLANVAPVFTDLVPDANGVVRIERAKLADRSLVQVLATDLRDADWREVALPEAPTQFRDLRLARNLDPAKSFAEKKRFSVLAKGQTLTLADRLTSELETYDTLASVFALYQTLSGNETLAKFAWVLEWPRLKDEEKRGKYSEFACHELNFFLSRKDPEFFAKVVKPYLANKKDKTFLDEYLLGADLRRFAEPWHFSWLNAAERALLATRLDAEAKNIARHLRERWELLPSKPDELDRLFETALRGRAMEEGERAGEKLAELKKLDALKSIRRLAATMPAPASPVPASAMARGTFGGVAGRSMTTNEPVAADADKDGANRQVVAGAEVMLAEGADAIGFSVISADEAGLQRQQAKAQAYYRALGPTKEWAENNYYKLDLKQQNAGLIPMNAFWRDFAESVANGAKAPFLSANFAEAHTNFSEMMLALAVLDLPFDAPKHDVQTDGASFTLTAGGPVIVTHKEVLPATPAAGATELLVSQNFYRHGDRYRTEGNEKFDKYVTDEFLVGAVYGANVVVTNPTSSPQKLELLLQIPRGALPVLCAKPTDSRRVRLEPFTTQSFEYAFYFPAAGAEKFPHYPVSVAKGEKIVGAAKAFAFPVVARLTQVDKASWEFVSQYGTDAEALAFIEQNNIERLSLEKIAWRCRKSVEFFRRLVALLEARHHFDRTIYSYAVMHGEFAPLREYLRHRDELLFLCGDWLDTRLVRLDPIEKRRFEQLEYSPLVNQRTHRLGAEHRIANNVVLQQYRELLDGLCTKAALDAADQMRVVTFLFAQDRVEEALARFKAVNADALPTRIQHDYFRCYAAFYEADLAAARGIANQYADHPVERWRGLFREVLAQADEMDGKDRKDEKMDNAKLAASEAAFDFKVENRMIALTWKNLGEVTLNYYLIDPEFSFSSNPFVSADAGRSSIIKPTKTAQLPLPAGKDALDVPLPAEFAKANVLVEIVGAGQRKAQAYHANTLTLALAENYGRLDLRDAAAKPVAKAYVKVYARLNNGTVRFFKDGYTDLRGKFDYASLNGSESPAPPQPVPQTVPGSLDTQMLRPGELGQVERLAVLVLSESNGALVREVAPPAQ